MPNLWPVLLPAFSIVENFQEEEADTTIRSPMEEGPAKLRQNPNTTPPPLRFNKRLSLEQVNILKAFYRVTLAKGVLPFQEYHPVEGRLLTFRFLRPPSFQHISGSSFMASIELEVLPS